LTQVRGPDRFARGADNALSIANNQMLGNAPESFVTSGARNLAGQTIRGDFLNAGNPHLQQLSQNIGDQVFNQTQQRFAGSGRNVNSQGAQGQFREDFQNQLSPIFAQNFENERQRQMSAMSQSSQFDPLNQFISRFGPLAAANLDKDVVGQGVQTGNTTNTPSMFDQVLGIADVIIPG
jgi:hypothetical protein